ncbi:MAG: RNA-binding domain-containing protein [Nitrospirota bacterium]
MEKLLADLITLPKETEWVEFKVDYYDPQEIGEQISALSNSACLHNKAKGYLVFGIENETHNVRGTHFKPKQKKIGNEELENWLAKLLNPRIDFVIYEFQYSGKQIVLFEIDATENTPVRFSGVTYIRVGSYKKKLSDHPEKERKIWKKQAEYDWSAQICKGATIDDLDKDAIQKARIEYKNKNSRLAKEVDRWDDIKFLNNAKVTIHGKITRTAIILLGNEESTHFLSPSVAQMTWILKDEHNIEKDYAHFGPPFLLNIEKLFGKIRNLKYRYMPDNTLFPTEIDQYDSWVIREALHNCIAHQDYELRGRINVIENPDELIFTNVGSFIPGSVEEVIKLDAPPTQYRNDHLVRAMLNLNMIETIGSGIKKMFQKQRQRFFPLPSYDLTDPEKVIVKIQGKILNENYTRLLIEQMNLGLSTVMLLDKVQKRINISKDEHKFLKSKRFVEGRYPKLFVSSQIAATTGKKAQHIKNKGFDKKYYQDLIIEFIKKYDSAPREEINELLLDKLPDIMTKEQKTRKIHNMLSEMSGKLTMIKNIGSRKKSSWILNDMNKKTIKKQ